MKKTIKGIKIESIKELNKALEIYINMYRLSIGKEEGLYEKEIPQISVNKKFTEEFCTDTITFTNGDVVINSMFIATKKNLQKALIDCIKVVRFSLGWRFEKLHGIKSLPYEIEQQKEDKQKINGILIYLYNKEKFHLFNKTIEKDVVDLADKSTNVLKLKDM